MLKLRSLVIALALAAALSPAAYAASADKTFTVNNTGDGPLTITGAGISGNTAEYALLSGHNCTTVAAGNSCAMTVRFTPTGSGARGAASLNFNSNGTNGGAHSIALSGTGGSSCAAGKVVYSYTGADRNITVPAGCTTATIKAWGAGGKAGAPGASNFTSGGGGGFASRTVSGLTSGSQFVVVVGQGAVGKEPTYGGGGSGRTYTIYNGGAGGGLSGVFAGTKSQANAILIAGGGGGGYGAYSAGFSAGAGGGESGVAGANWLYTGGQGGTQTAGGARGSVVGGTAGTALQGGTYSGTSAAAGGGGGYFGGGGAGVASGGGGSGYAPGGTLIAGSGCNVANGGDGDAVNIGSGGCTVNASGQNGLVVLIWQ